MPSLSIDGQIAGAVESQVGLRKEDSVDVVIVDGYVFPAVGQDIFCPFSQGNKDLIRLQGIDGGGGTAGNIRTCENQLYLVGFPGVYYKSGRR